MPDSKLQIQGLLGYLGDITEASACDFPLGGRKWSQGASPRLGVACMWARGFGTGDGHCGLVGVRQGTLLPHSALAVLLKAWNLLSV